MRKILFILLAMCVCSCEPTQCRIYPTGCYTNEQVREYQHHQAQKYGKCVYFKWDEDGIVHCGCYDDRCVEHETTLGVGEWLKTKKIAKPNHCSSFWWDKHGTKHCGCYDDRCVEIESSKEILRKNKNTRKIR